MVKGLGSVPGRTRGFAVIRSRFPPWPGSCGNRFRLAVKGGSPRDRLSAVHMRAYGMINSREEKRCAGRSRQVRRGIFVCGGQARFAFYFERHGRVRLCTMSVRPIIEVTSCRTGRDNRIRGVPQGRRSRSRRRNRESRRSGSSPRGRSRGRSGAAEAPSGRGLWSRARGSSRQGRAHPTEGRGAALRSRWSRAAGSPPERGEAAAAPSGSSPRRRGAAAAGERKGARR